MIGARFCLALVPIAFVCFGSVTEGRLFDPSIKALRDETEGKEDPASLDALVSETTKIATATTTTKASSIAINAATSKLTNFVANSSMCDAIHPEDLPEECSCSEPGPFALLIECNKKFNSTYFNDTIGMKIDLDPCNEEGAKLSLDVTEQNHDIEYMLAGIRAGESKNIPIPGLAMIVPGLGNVGLDVAVLIAGNPDMLRLKIGLNACAQTSTDHDVCASDIPGISSILPWYILKGTYSFGDVCSALEAIRNEQTIDDHRNVLADSRQLQLDQPEEERDFRDDEEDNNNNEIKTGEIIEEKIEQGGEVIEAGEIIEQKKKQNEEDVKEESGEEEENEDEVAESAEEASEEKENEDAAEESEEEKESHEISESSTKSRTYSFDLSSLNDGETGTIVIVTKPEWAPLGVEQFHKLLDNNFFQDAKFFRVVDDFVVQFGLPAIPTKEWDTPIKDDPVVGTNARGTITFATGGPNTRTTQLFINTAKNGNKRLDLLGFAPIAVVAEGMELVDEIYAKYKEEPEQWQIEKEGNKYLDKWFPLLSYISNVDRE